MKRRRGLGFVKVDRCAGNEGIFCLEMVLEQYDLA